ncbi:hypothetical protein CVT24_007686 [Panaeolus cyanescens]|uniref:WSC domain-containing protein n=1 Tax=Panaeolus cyanescens TaxID=181874 RepID=A0A409VRL8_9AGAR|nr:hypothetical protein CVT24_007686 [Panaeolus cyanescens]
MAAPDDPQTIKIDSGHPSIFHQGFWQEQNLTGLSLFNNSASFTNTSESTKVVRFVGTSITVGGGLQPIGNTKNLPLEVRFSIDNGQASPYSPDAPDAYTVLLYYQSGSLPMGEHVLAVTNLVNGDIVHLDYFEIEASGGKPQILKSDGSLVPSHSSSITPVADPTITLSHSSTTAMTSIANKLSPFSSAIQTLTSHTLSSSPPANSSQHAADLVGPGASSTLSAQGVNASNTASTAPIPSQSHDKLIIIIASLLGSLLFVVCTVFLALQYRRRRRQKIIHRWSQLYGLTYQQGAYTHTSGLYETESRQLWRSSGVLSSSRDSLHSDFPGSTPDKGVDGGNRSEKSVPGSTRRPDRNGDSRDALPRALHYGAPPAPQNPMAATDCINYCTSCGMALAGVEYGEECYCSNGFLHDYGTSSSCNMPCRGNPLEMCGGPNALNVYATGVRPYTTGPAIAPASYKGYLLTQCWQDDTWPLGGGRILPHWPSTPILPEQMSIFKCIDGCAASGYTSAGVEWGQECWCGNVTFPPGQSTEFSQCDMPCHGDAGQLCGGSNRIIIYNKP